MYLHLPRGVAIFCNPLLDLVTPRCTAPLVHIIVSFVHLVGVCCGVFFLLPTKKLVLLAKCETEQDLCPIMLGLIGVINLRAATKSRFKCCGSTGYGEVAQNLATVCRSG